MCAQWWTQKVASQRGDGQRGEDRKVDLIVDEMKTKRYDVKVAALQETKWFGSEVYHVGGSVVLTAGREKPALDDRVQRGEWVAIMLFGPAIDAWKRAGRQWKAWSPRTVSACLHASGERFGGKAACGVLLCTNKSC